jgi:hypothetical protein
MSPDERAVVDFRAKRPSARSLGIICEDPRSAENAATQRQISADRRKTILIA